MKRQPEGVPAGGQFAADRKNEPAGSLQPTQLPSHGTSCSFQVGAETVTGTWSGITAGERSLTTRHGTVIHFSQDSYGTEITLAPRFGSKARTVRRWYESTDDGLTKIPEVLAEGARNRAVASVFRRPSDFILKSISTDSTHGRLDQMALYFAGPEQYLRDDDGVEVSYNFVSGLMFESSPGPDPHDGRYVINEKTGLSPQQAFEAVHRILLGDPESGISS